MPRRRATKTRKMYAAINISAGYEFWVKIKNDTPPKICTNFPAAQIPSVLHSPLRIPCMKISQHIDNNMPCVATLCHCVAIDVYCHTIARYTS